jgi:polyhydroxybutyrate depolymerase
MRVFLVLIAVLLATSSFAQERSATIEGRERTWTVERASSGSGGPLLVMLHGSLQDDKAFRALTSFSRLANEGATLVWLNGLANNWADGRRPEERSGRAPPANVDDVRYIDAVIEQVRAEAGTDPRRVHLVGASAGGIMALTYACVRAEQVASVTAFISAMPRSLLDRCKLAAPVRLLVVNGTADPVIPFEGSSFANPRRLAVPATSETISFWRRANGCPVEDGESRALPDHNPSDRTRLTLVTSKCPPGREVSLIRVEGGGHRLPSTRATNIAPSAVRMFGAQNHDVDASDLVADFVRLGPQRGIITQ